jgi:hypothetical protein
VICILEVALAVYGLMALVKGRMSLGKKVVVGTPARVLGLLAMAPLPIAFTAGVIYGAQQAAAGKGQLGNDDTLTLAAIEAGIVIVTALVVFGIAATLAIPVEEADRLERRANRRYDDDEDYEYDREYDRDRDSDLDSDRGRDRDRDRGRDRDRW